jgi:hypothetical protein
LVAEPGAVFLLLVQQELPGTQDSLARRADELGMKKRGGGARSLMARVRMIFGTNKFHRVHSAAR